MFKELAPLLRQRSVLFTVTHIEEDEFRVNLIPKKTADSENNALTTPLSVTGTPEELDDLLPATLTSFVASNLELKNSLARAKTEMEAAAKAAQDEARNKAKANKKAPPEPTKKEEPKKETAGLRAPGLFDGESSASGTSSMRPLSPEPEELNEESEILAEIAENELNDEDAA